MTVTRRMIVALAFALVGFGLIIGPHAHVPAAAQATFDCPLPVATPAARELATTPGPAPDAEFPVAGGDVTVFAAASLTDAFSQMKAELEAEHPDLTITLNFAGSQTLVTQLAAGAAADVFASANTKQMEAAIEDGSIVGEPVTFVQNELAIVTPADNPAGIATPADLANDGLLLVLAQPEVPVGRYARQSICAMSRDTATYGEDFAGRVSANVVSQEEDVRAVLTKVQLGEADAGIVYVSDAAIASDAVNLIAIPGEVNVIANYPIAAVIGGDQALADAFIAYVLSDEGQATLAGYGFTPVTP